MKKLEWIKKASGIWRIDITPDVIGLVSWNLGKKERTTKKVGYIIKTQIQGPSQNQYRYKGVVQCDNERKAVYGNNVETVQRMVIVRAKAMMKKRLDDYQKALDSEYVFTKSKR